MRHTPPTLHPPAYNAQGGRDTTHDVLLAAALAAAVPAFYLLLTAERGMLYATGSLLYLLSAALTAAAFGIAWRRRHGLLRLVPEGLIFLGALACAWPPSLPWSAAQWWLRLGFSALILMRLVPVILRWSTRQPLMQILLIGTVLLALSGAGFYWLDPQVPGYADGLWLAFTTAATVGYGDLVPSTVASRVFAVFTVLLGYAIFSLVTARIAALLVDEDEKKLARELHQDIRALRHEITVLHREIGNLRQPPPG